MIDYRVIQKSAIPPTPPATNENYGEWLAIARLLAKLAPHEAIAVELQGRNCAGVVSSLHSAGRVAGVRISTMRSGDRLYCFRIGTTIPAPPPKRWDFQCMACKRWKTGNRRGQKYCSEDGCQRERKNKNNRNCYGRSA